MLETTVSNLHVAITFHDPALRTRPWSWSEVRSQADSLWKGIRYPRRALARRGLNRWEQLVTVVRHLTLLSTERLFLTIYTNAGAEEFAGISAMLSAMPSGDLKVITVTDSELDHPYLLTWEHRRDLEALADEFGEHDVFVYLEDDLVFTDASLGYWLSARPVLAPLGFVPSYFRVEYAAHLKHLVSTDLHDPARTSNGVAFRDAESGRLFVQSDNPYCGMYVLDAELMRELVSSVAFSEVSSRVLPWEVRERAAAGLMHVNPPEGFPARGAIEVHPRSGLPVPGALIDHLGNRFARDRSSVFGTEPYRPGIFDLGSVREIPPRSVIP